MYCFVIKATWMLFYVGYKTKELLPTTSGIASSAPSTQLSMILTAGALCLTFFFDFLSLLQGELAWVGFASFSALALLTGNAIFMPLLVIPPLLDYLHGLWRTFTTPSTQETHKCNYDEAAKRMAGINYHYAEMARQRERTDRHLAMIEAINRRNARGQEVIEVP